MQGNGNLSGNQSITKEPTTRGVGTAKEGKMNHVDIDKLDTDNYAVWSVKMKAYLVIKGHLEYHQR